MPIEGIVLRQQEDESNRPVVYWTRTLNDNEQKLSTMQSERLAVVRAVKLLCSYPERTRFTIWTDHKALQWILTMAEATGKLLLSVLRLSEFHFCIVH